MLKRRDQIGKGQDGASQTQAMSSSQYADAVSALVAHEVAQAHLNLTPVTQTLIQSQTRARAQDQDPIQTRDQAGGHPRPLVQGSETGSDVYLHVAAEAAATIAKPVGEEEGHCRKTEKKVLVDTGGRPWSKNNVARSLYHM